MLRVHGFTKKHAALLQMAVALSASVHSSAARKSSSGSDLEVEISDNILAAGIRYLKGDPERLQENLRKRKAGVDLESMLASREKLRLCMVELNKMRHNRNVLSREIANAKEMDSPQDQGDGDHIAVAGNETHDNDTQDNDTQDNDTQDSHRTGASIKRSLKNLQEEVEQLRTELLSLVLHIPNFTHPDVPEGGYDASRVVHIHGSKPEFSFPILDHLEIGEKHQLIDFSTPAMVSGRNFYYLKGAAAMLELALIQFAMQKAASKGYHPVMTPDIVKTAMVGGCGFNPRTAHNQVYKLLGYKNRLCLTGTAEIPLAGMFLGELLPLKKMPLRYVAFGRCFRTESGGFGLAPRGLYRVHQFSKVELFGVTADETGEESESMLQEMLDMQKEIAEELGFHYRVLEMSTEELGSPAYHKYDVEVWMPGRDEYGEVCSASNCTDYQSMRLKTVYHNPAFNSDRSQPKKKYAHTVNATACAIPRLIIALLENYQQEDGSVLIPKALHPFLPPDCWHIHS